MILYKKPGVYADFRFKSRFKIKVLYLMRFWEVRE